MSHKLGQKMLHLGVIDQDITGPSRKVNKSHRFAKKCSWAWKLQWRWNQKGCLEDILCFLKSPRTPKNVENWARYKLCKLSIFWGGAWRKIPSKSQTFSNWPKILWFKLDHKIIHDYYAACHASHHFIYLFFEFNNLNSNLIK